MQVIKYAFQQHGDERGMLVALEEFKDIPFEIKRVYFMYETKSDIHRGFHAHKNLEQILICIHGSCKVRLDNGLEKKWYHWKNHMKDFIYQMTCGERCMIFRKMRYFSYWHLIFIMKRIT